MDPWELQERGDYRGGECSEANVGGRESERTVEGGGGRWDEEKGDEAFVREAGRRLETESVVWAPLRHDASESAAWSPRGGRWSSGFISLFLKYDQIELRNVRL